MWSVAEWMSSVVNSDKFSAGSTDFFDVHAFASSGMVVVKSHDPSMLKRDNAPMGKGKTHLRDGFGGAR